MERECKLIFRDDTLAPSIFEILSTSPAIGGYSNRGKRAWGTEDVYFDTSDLSLERLQCGCRVRTIGGDKILELKKRTEDVGYKACYERKQFPIDASVHKQIPFIREKLRSFVPPDLRDKEIGAVLRVQTRRTEVSWGADFSTSEFLMHLDEVQYFLPHTSEVIGTHFEVELKEDPEGVHVDVFREILCNLFGLIPIRRSKLARCSRLLKHIRERAVGSPQKVILDMDPGVDDALAILLAMNSPEMEVLAITTVAGNIDAKCSSRNARIVLDFIRDNAPDHSMPIVACGGTPETRGQDASDVHGPDGLGGISSAWGEPRTPLSKNRAVEVIKDLLAQHLKDITLIATGPLTNIAECIQRHPEAMRQVKELVVMGGVFFESGNRTQAAEFNIHADPKAAKIVLDFCRGSGSEEVIPLTFVGLDVTHQVRLRREWVRALADKGHPVGQFVEKFAACYMDFYRRNEGLNGCYLHDPLAVGCVIDPTFCEMEHYHVEVETKGEHTCGMTVADYRPTQIFKCLSKINFIFFPIIPNHSFDVFYQVLPT